MAQTTTSKKSKVNTLRSVNVHLSDEKADRFSVLCSLKNKTKIDLATEILQNAIDENKEIIDAFIALRNQVK